MLKYVSTDAITPQLQNLALTGSTLSHRLTYNIAGDTLTISCHYNDCASAPIVIALPEKTSDLFTKIEVEGTCCEPGSITYSFSYASAREIILEYQAELSNSYYNYSLNDIADFLASNYLSAVYFEINSNNHPADMLVLDETKPTVLPEFNYTNCYVHLAEAGFNRSLPAEGGGTTQGVTEGECVHKRLRCFINLQKKRARSRALFSFFMKF